jgi:hypothetical protein
MREKRRKVSSKTAFSCPFYSMKVFWNTRMPNPKAGKPTLYNERDNEDLDIAHVCSVQRTLYKQMREEENARLNFIASVKPETASAILGDATDNSNSGLSVIFKMQKVTGGVK